MNVKSMLFICGGFVAGSVSGILATKRYFQNKYQKQYEQDHDDLEEYYHRTDEYARQEHEDHKASDVEYQNESPLGGRMNSEERNEVREKLKKNWAGTTNYAAMYERRNNVAEEDGNNEEEDDGQNEINPLDEEAFDEHQKNKDRKPKIISAEAYSNLPARIDQETLYFYAYDEMLTDENEEPIEEPERLVGDSLTKYGFINSDEQVIFVMNYSLDTCYEIQKVDASWTDTH